MEHIINSKALIPVQTLEYHLDEATLLIPSFVFEISDFSRDAIKENKELSYYDFWLEYIQDIGIFLENRNEEELLPSIFWQHLINAAYLMKANEFIPYLVGKMNGKKKEGLYSVIPSIIYIGKKLLQEKDFENTPILQKIANLESSFIVLCPHDFQNTDIQKIITSFEENVKNNTITKEQLNKLNDIWCEMFYDLFNLITSPNFPSQLSNYAWSIINFNTFTFSLIDNPNLISTNVVVWWEDQS